MPAMYFISTKFSTQMYTVHPYTAEIYNQFPKRATHTHNEREKGGEWKLPPLLFQFNFPPCTTAFLVLLKVLCLKASA